MSDLHDTHPVQLVTFCTYLYNDMCYPGRCAPPYSTQYSCSTLLYTVLLHHPILHCTLLFGYHTSYNIYHFSCMFFIVTIILFFGQTNNVVRISISRPQSKPAFIRILQDLNYLPNAAGTFHWTIYLLRLYTA